MGHIKLFYEKDDVIILNLNSNQNIITITKETFKLIITYTVIDNYFQEIGTIYFLNKKYNGSTITYSHSFIGEVIFPANVTYCYTIIGGTKKFLNKKGNIKLAVNESGLKTLTIKNG